MCTIIICLMLFMINNNIADKQRKINNTIYLNLVALSCTSKRTIKIVGH